MTRVCGSCQLCCKLLPVKGLDKPANQRCRHQAVGKGCRVYHRPGFPSECAVWNCRWLLNEAGSVKRPDRTHYVIDVMPDLVLAQAVDGETTEIMVIQVWVDPAWPDAWRDPALLDLAEKTNQALLIRFNSNQAITVFPPGLATDRQWHVVTNAIDVKSESGSLLLDALRESRQ